MTNIAEFNRRYKVNEFQFRQLFRRYRIKSSGLQGIQEGHSRFGEPFLVLAIDILNNKKPDSNFSNYGDPYLEEEAYIDDIPFDTAAVAAEANKGKGWDFLNNLLSFGNSAADTIKNIRYSINGTLPETTTVPAENPPPKVNFLMIGAIAAAILLVVLLIRKK